MGREKKVGGRIKGARRKKGGEKKEEMLHRE